MILVDTSVWVRLLNRRPRQTFSPAELIHFATCGPIVQEVLQGLRPGTVSEAFRDSFLAPPVISDPTPLRLFLEAARIYSEGRRRGLTIRSSVDCLIAAIAVDNGVPIWHADRDFTAIATYTPLRTIRPN